MKRLLDIFFVLVIGSMRLIYPPLDTVQNMDDIGLVDVKLSRYTSGYKIRSSGDHMLHNNPFCLTDPKKSI